jgi:hypothetical protein
MKIIQAGILACLLVIAGLLAAIFYNQRSQLPAEAPAALEATLSEPAALIEPSTPAEAPPAETVAEVKASPAPARKPSPPKAQPVKSKPAAAPLPVETPPAQEPEPVREAAVAPAPAPVVKPEPAPPPPPPPEPRVVTIPAGTEIRVRTIQTLSSDRNSAGDTFLATLDDDLMIDNIIVADKGARVEGRVVETRRAGRVKDVSNLVVELSSLETADGQTIGIATQRIHREGEESKGSDAKKIGIATGIGAVIGAIAGGGKGAAIGAGAGAGAGTGTVMATRGEDVTIRSETRLQFRLLDSVQVVEKL